VQTTADLAVTTSREDFRALAAEHRVVPVTRKVLADSETPLSAYRKLAANRPGTFLLESAENGRSWSRWSFIGAGNVIIGPVKIGNHIMTAQHVVMSGMNHGFADVNTGFRYQPCTTALITIGDGCWIGANSVITAGVTIGKYCVIGAGSVVTKDVPDYSMAAGSPARVIKQFNHQTKEWERVIPQL